MILEALFLAGVLGAGQSWTQILLSNQLQCKDPYAMTVGIPQGEKEAVIRVEKDGKVLAEKKLGRLSAAEASVFDVDDSGCEEALIDLTSDEKRMTVIVTFPKGKPAIATYGPTDKSASKAQRNRTSLRVYEQRKGKLCITDYAVKRDTLSKVFEDCY
jgi:biopolymer transport protein ExbD